MLLQILLSVLCIPVYLNAHDNRLSTDRRRGHETEVVGTCELPTEGLGT